MTAKTLRAYGTGCGYSLLLRLGLAVGVVALLGLCGLAAWVVPLPPGVDRERVFLLSFGLAILVVTAVAVSAAVLVVVRRGRMVDAAFQPLGLAGKWFLSNGRQFHGDYAGRALNAYFYRGPTLDLYLGTRLKTRLSLTQRDAVGGAVAGLFKPAPLNLRHQDMHWVAAYALDPAWAAQLFEVPLARSVALRLLTTTDNGPELRQLGLQPEALHLQLRYAKVDNITTENLRGWLDDMRALLRIAEAEPAPQVTAEAGPVERSARANRGVFALAMMAVLLFVLSGIGACAFLLSLLTQSAS